MTLADWIALITPVSAVLGGGGIAVTKLTRIAVAVEQLVKSGEAVTKTVADHEQRLTKGGL